MPFTVLQCVNKDIIIIIIIRYKFSGLYKDMVSTLWLYNAYKEFPKIVSTQFCNYTVI